MLEKALLLKYKVVHSLFLNFSLHSSSIFQVKYLRNILSNALGINLEHLLLPFPNYVDKISISKSAKSDQHVSAVSDFQFALVKKTPQHHIAAQAGGLLSSLKAL